MEKVFSRKEIDLLSSIWISTVSKRLPTLRLFYGTQKVSFLHLAIFYISRPFLGLETNLAKPSEQEATEERPVVHSNNPCFHIFMWSLWSASNLAASHISSFGLFLPPDGRPTVNFLLSNSSVPRWCEMPSLPNFHNLLCLSLDILARPIACLLV